MSRALAARLITCAEQSEIGRNFADTPHACRDAAAKLAPVAKPLERYHEDMGNVLWWKFPVDEPPYVGSPLDCEWPGYHTHFTPLPEVPERPE